MSVEAPVRQEINSSPEAQEVVRGHQFSALHPRLLIGGEALNPQRVDLPAVTVENLGNIKQRDYRVFGKASTNERRAYWNTREETNFEQQKQAWIKQVTTTFQNSNKFFTESERGKHWNEVLSRVGIQASEFSAEQAESFYQKYFQIQNTDERLKMFVYEIISSPNYKDADLEAINWLVHTFGKNSAEVITHLVIAEKQLQKNPEELVQCANQIIKRDQVQVSRINILTPDEKRILEFLNGEGQKEESRGVTPRGDNQRIPKRSSGETSVSIRPVRRKKGFGWRYEKPTEPRKFPHEQMVSQLLNPVSIADRLKRKNPGRYAGISTHLLAHEIKIEQQRLESELNKVGLDHQRLVDAANSAVDYYKHFIEREYGVKVPAIGNVRIQPIWKKTAESFPISKGGLAFVNDGFPIIFLNMDEIPNAARRLGFELGLGWEHMSNEVLGRLMVRVLNEIHPHEYNHLTGDVAYWKYVKNTAEGEKVERIVPGKMGLWVAKPVKYKQGDVIDYEYKARGVELMEAVTTEITNRWAESMNQQLDLQGTYPFEREVLIHLEKLLASEQGISRKEAFKKFVKAYFSPKADFSNLVKDLSGPKDRNGKYLRPHFLSIIYGLMGYESKKFQHLGRPGRYDLTLSFINNQLTPEQKAELAHNIKHLQLSPFIERYMLNTLSRT